MQNRNNSEQAMNANPREVETFSTETECTKKDIPVQYINQDNVVQMVETDSHYRTQESQSSDKTPASGENFHGEANQTEKKDSSEFSKKKQAEA